MGVSGFSNNNHGGFCKIDFDFFLKKKIMKNTMVTVKWSLLFFVTGLVFLFAALHNVQADSEGHELIGPGACRGPDWSDDEWPIAVGDKSLEECCEKCQKTRECTAFSLGKAKKAKKPCMLYSHDDVQPAASLGGECYKIVAGAAGKKSEDGGEKKEKRKTQPKTGKGSEETGCTTTREKGRSKTRE